VDGRPSYRAGVDVGGSEQQMLQQFNVAVLHCNVHARLLPQLCRVRSGRCIMNQR
jgi:hypothetical protein